MMEESSFTCEVFTDSHLVSAILDFQRGIAFKDYHNGDMAMRAGHMELMKLKHESEAKDFVYTDDAVWVAVSQGDLETVKFIITRGNSGAIIKPYDRARGANQSPIPLHWGFGSERRRPQSGYKGYHRRLDGYTSRAGEGDSLEALEALLAEETSHNVDQCSGGEDYSIKEDSKLLVTDLAAVGGHLDILTWLSDNTTYQLGEWGLWGAIKNGHLKVVEWLLPKMAISICIDEHNLYEKAKRLAAFYGQIKLFEWLSAQGPTSCRTTTLSLSIPAQGGRLDFLLWSKEFYPEWVDRDQALIYDKALLNAHWDIVDWMKELYPDVTSRHRPSSLQLCQAAVNGHVDVLMYLERQFPELGGWPSTRDLMRIVEAGQLKVLEWLHSRSKGIHFGSNAVGSAICKGHVSVAKWILSICPVLKDCLPDNLLVLAVKSGDLGAVQFAYEICGDATFSAKLALELAVALGHLDIVQYLDESCRITEGLSDNEYEFWWWLEYLLGMAAGEGHVDTFKFLFEVRLRRFGPDSANLIVDHAICGGSLAIVQYLWSRLEGLVPYSGRKLDEALESGHWQTVYWVLSQPYLRLPMESGRNRWIMWRLNDYSTFRKNLYYRAKNTLEPVMSELSDEDRQGLDMRLREYFTESENVFFRSEQEYQYVRENDWKIFTKLENLMQGAAEKIQGGADAGPTVWAALTGFLEQITE